MADRLKPHGYTVFTIDIQWYEPEAKSYDYNTHPTPAMDGFGRLLPAPNRFPSAQDGAGFHRLKTAPVSSRSPTRSTRLDSSSAST